MNPGPCAKQTVTATVISPAGKRFLGTNYCLTPQLICPRKDMPTGVGYELCKSVCNQSAHAEVNALEEAGLHANGSTLYLEGHSYVCDSCKSACQQVGVSAIVIGPPPKGE